MSHINTHSLPFIPGNTFTDPTKSKFHVSQTLDYKNGYAVPRKPTVGLGGDPIHFNSLNESELDSLANFKPTLTYGQAKQAPPQAFIPANVAFDKKVLQFNAYFKQTIYESANEYFRVRPVKIYYYLEDDTIAVLEPHVENSGMPQGKFLKRQRLPMDNVTGKYYTFKDIKIQSTVTFYGHVFYVVSCDKWSREYMESEGLVVNEDVPMPKDPYIEKRREEIAPKTTETPSDFDKLRQFLKLDKKVLRFFCVWDDRSAMFGEKRPFIIHYYLVDDSVEIREVHLANDGRDPFPLLLAKTRLPKDIYDIPTSFPSISMEAKETEHKAYFTPEDFMIGKTVTMLNRRFLIYDVDQFTKEFYRFNYGIKDFTPLKMENQINTIPEKVIPPYNGFGSVEDSLGSCFSLVPLPPKKDFIKMLDSGVKSLRYLVVLDENKIEKPQEAHLQRKFIMFYHLGTDTISIYELNIKNAGRRAGKHLNKTRIPKPGSDINKPEFYGPQDMMIGSIVQAFNHRFKIIDADDFVLSYLEAHHSRFPNIEPAVQSLREFKSLGESLPKPDTYDLYAYHGATNHKDLMKEVSNQLRKQHYNRFHTIQSAFLSLDRNRDKYINPDELIRHIHNINLPLPDSLIHEIFKIIDKNNDGQISWEEFIAFIENSEEYN